MRPAAFTASFLLHAGVLCAAWAWRVNAPTAQRAGDGGPVDDFSFFAAAPAEADPAEEVIALVEFTPPLPQPVEPVTAVVAPIFSTPAEAIAATPTAVVSAVPAVPARSTKHSGTRGSGGGTGYQPPRYRVCPAPPYPAAARAQRLEGAALLFVVVDDTGRPTKVTLRRSTGSAVLDQAAIRAVWAWQFEPARAGGRTIAASVEVPVRFRYRG